jgi:PPOX class probable F420-dependent enzyme
VPATDELWEIIAAGRDGIVATANEDGTPQLSNIYYLVDPDAARIRFSTTTTRRKGKNLLRFPRATLHVAGRDFYNFAVAEGDVSLAIATAPNDAAVDELFEIHSALGAASEREGFGEQMMADHRMVARIHVTRIYGQLLEPGPRSGS